VATAVAGGVEQVQRLLAEAETGLAAKASEIEANIKGLSAERMPAT
jgi:hypothetical protein